MAGEMSLPELRGFVGSMPEDMVLRIVFTAGQNRQDRHGESQ